MRFNNHLPPWHDAARSPSGYQPSTWDFPASSWEEMNHSFYITHNVGLLQQKETESGKVTTTRMAPSCPPPLESSLAPMSFPPTHLSITATDTGREKFPLSHSPNTTLRTTQRLLQQKMVDCSRGDGFMGRSPEFNHSQVWWPTAEAEAGRSLGLADQLT